MIRVRIDDVMCRSSAYDGIPGQSMKRLKWTFHSLSLVPGEIRHVPTILVREISEFPEAIELLQEYTNRGLCSPQLHGYEHINYGDDKDGNPEMVVAEILSHLEPCMEWFSNILGFEPSIWSTPWGACNDNMLEAAEIFGLKIETTHGTITPVEAIAQLKKGNDIHNHTIMEHWWRKGRNLLRLVEIVKAGSYELAVEANKELFTSEV